MTAAMIFFFLKIQSVISRDTWLPWLNLPRINWHYQFWFNRHSSGIIEDLISKLNANHFVVGFIFIVVKKMLSVIVYYYRLLVYCSLVIYRRHLTGGAAL